MGDCWVGGVWGRDGKWVGNADRVQVLGLFWFGRAGWLVIVLTTFVWSIYLGSVRNAWDGMFCPGLYLWYGYALGSKLLKISWVMGRETGILAC